MHKGPKNWKDGAREGAGKVKHANDDLRLTAVREGVRKPEGRRTRQINFRGTEGLKARIVELVNRHNIRQYELMELGVNAFEEKYGGPEPGDLEVNKVTGQ